MAEKTVVILGATGSIGTQTLDVLEELKNFKLVGFTYHTNSKLAEKVARRFGVSEFVSTRDGIERVLSMVERLRPDITVVAIPGFSGFELALGVIPFTRRLALATKEALVCGGWLVKEKLEEHRTELVPIDSEHSAIFRVFSKDAVKIAITATGGALRNWPIEKLKEATIEDVMRHPVWRMGVRVTVDSATMMNKVFEMIEATELFDLEIHQVEAYLHREGLVHGMVFFKDGSVKMSVFKPDMRIPISLALTYPDISYKETHPDFSILSFEEIDTKRYPLFSLSDVVHSSYALRTAVNAADEIAVEMFEKGEIRFTDIERVVLEVVEKFECSDEPRDLEDLKRIDGRARKIALEVVKNVSNRE